MAFDASPTPPVASTMDSGRTRRGIGLVGMAAKVAVSFGLLAWLFVHADTAALAARLKEVSWGWLAVGFVTKSMTIPMAALRWRSVTALVGVRFGRLDALRLTIASVFLGQALPGAVGGDIVRGWLTARLGFPASAIVLALVVDRVAALLGVIVLVIIGLPHLVTLAPAGTGALVTAAVAVISGGAVVLCFIDLLPLPAFLRRRPAVTALQQLVTDMRRSLRTGRGGGALVWSALVHVCTVGAAVFFVRALNVPASVLDCLAVVPFTIIAAALPVSLAGWGMREGSMAAGFALLGLASEDAVAVSLLIGVSGLLMSLPGAFVWLFWRPTPRSVPSSSPEGVS